MRKYLPKGIVKLILPLLLLTFIGCKEKVKLQKNTSFQPECVHIHNNSVSKDLTCSNKGIVACGTVPGSININTYCIDSNDNILENSTPTCKSDNREDQCMLIVQTGDTDTSKIQKNSTFLPSCGSNTYSTPNCTGSKKAACGTTSGSNVKP